MGRSCIKYDLEEFKEAYEIEDNCNFQLFVDSREEADIIDFLKNKKRKKKFLYILHCIETNNYLDHLYGREPYGLYAMKWKSDNNPRIYCKEFYGKIKNIVMIFLLRNKAFQRAQNKHINSKLESISTYEYKFE